MRLFSESADPGTLEVHMAISVVIKTLNEEKRIAAAIESALEAIGDLGGEVIVADSGSSDRTVDIARQYPVVVVQIEPPAQASCGIGPQLGFQHSLYEYVCLIDGDMLLDNGFLGTAIKFLEENPDAAGATGHVEEVNLSNLEYARRIERNALENRAGVIDRMNGGGLYRRSAIESVGYFSDRNLHGYEEFDLGIRLRSDGWKLFRMDRRFVQHFGHTENSYRLLLRRWRTKYLQGIGEVLRASVGKPYFFETIRALPELRLWGLVYVWWALCLALIVIMPDWRLAVALIGAGFVGVVLLAAYKKGGFAMGLYTVIAWFFHAAALPFGFFRMRRDPQKPIESKRFGETA